MPTEAARHGMTGRSFKTGGIPPRVLSAEFFEQRYVKDFQNRPCAAFDTDGFSAPTGATGDINFAYWRDFSEAYHIKGAGQTLLAPSNDAANGGQLLGLDQVAAEGVEYLLGISATIHNPFRVRIGTDPNAFVKMTLRLGAVANGAECAVGWRKAEVFQANFDDYDELAALNAQAGVINRETILNNGATTTVNTGLTVTNAVNFTLEARLIGREVQMYVNGNRARIGVPFFFDVGEVVLPFLFFLQGGGASSLHRTLVECGPLHVIGKDPARRAA